MKIKWLVTGDHPILKRPDKYFDSFDMVRVYTDRLVEHGYENVKMKQVEIEVNK